ncbi:MAG: hypothetical protein A3E87_08430 [Gammaproteobacteria bacterium RIFCSPHIGHO2_12_FULL_35_23]|nr:MAG: hypothetical protein A3E87_08430 [Gammaproteobacteria bacterium RIFCSPHIGHO2_12_FULL_35_23]
MGESLEGFIEANRISFHYKYVFEEDRFSKPTLVVFPGGPGFGLALYEAQISFLVNSVNILFFDPRGCGETPAQGDEDCYTLEGYIEDAYCLTRSLGMELGFSKFILYGTSYGGMAALGFTIQHPELVTQLILVSCAPSYHFFELARMELTERGDKSQRRMCQSYLWPGKFSRITVTDYFRELGPLYSRKVVKKTANPYDFPCNFQILNAALRTEYGRFDFTPRLAEIECPTLIMAGKHDWITPSSLAMTMQRAIPHSTMVIFSSAAHSIAKDVPEAFQATVREFLVSASLTERRAARREFGS